MITDVMTSLKTPPHIPGQARAVGAADDPRRPVVSNVIQSRSIIILNGVPADGTKFRATDDEDRYLRLYTVQKKAVRVQSLLSESARGVI
jgi:hypothetical protein